MRDNSRKNINFQHFSKEDKLRLKQRISHSVYSYKRRRNFKRYGLATASACVVILLAIGIFNFSNQEASTIQSFVKSQEDKNASTQVQLVLGKDKSVEINENNALISYSSNGESVQIGKDRPLTQNTSNRSKPLFNTLIVPFGKRSEITLSDGSKVWLNSGSKLIFPAQFQTDKREVYLEGEAIFEVTHREKKPFFVTSEHLEIKVLGTVFNVSNYKDDGVINTVLQSGSVQINVTEDAFLNTPENIKITPGTLAAFDKNARKITTKSVPIEPYFAWRDGIFIFKNDSLKSIMKKISRYYNVDIIINDENLAKETFSGYLDVKGDIEHVMQTIKETESSKFEYEWTEDNKLIIN